MAKQAESKAAPNGRSGANKFQLTEAEKQDIVRYLDTETASIGGGDAS